MVFFCLWLVRYLIPDVSRQVKRLKLREHYLAKEARYGIMFQNLGKESDLQVGYTKSSNDVAAAEAGCCMAPQPPVDV